MSYEVFTTGKVEKAIARLPDDAYQRMNDAIDALADDPRPPGCEKLSGRARTYNALLTEFEREPTDEEVAKALGWTVEEVRDVKGAMPDATSLNQPLSSDADGSELGEFLEDERASDTIGTVMRGMETEWLQEAIERLPERHRYVLVRRYGLDDREPATLAMLSDELDISRERVRQLQREAERMLASGEPGSALRDAAA